MDSGFKFQDLLNESSFIGDSIIINNITADTGIINSLSGNTLNYNRGIINNLRVNAIDSVDTSLDLGCASGTSTVNLACSPSIQTINIGGNGTTSRTNIGGVNDIVTIDGSLTYIDSNVLEVNNRTIFINKNGTTTTARNAGIVIEASGTTFAGFIRQNLQGNAYQFKNTENANVLNTPILSTNSTVLINQGNQIINGSLGTTGISATNIIGQGATFNNVSTQTLNVLSGATFNNVSTQTLNVLSGATFNNVNTQTLGVLSGATFNNVNTQTLNVLSGATMALLNFNPFVADALLKMNNTGQVSASLQESNICTLSTNQNISGAKTFNTLNGTTGNITTINSTTGNIGGINLFGTIGTNGYGFGTLANTTAYYTGANTSIFGHNFYGSNSSNFLMRIQGDGNVGIGTATPQYRLDVIGTQKITQGLRIDDGRITRGQDPSSLGTTDLGLYSAVAGNWIRMVTNNGRFHFSRDSGFGSSANGEIFCGNITSSGAITSTSLTSTTVATGSNTTPVSPGVPSITVGQNYVIEFGVGVSKEQNAGKIGYGTFDAGVSLNIVGAGSGANRLRGLCRGL